MGGGAQLKNKRKVLHVEFTHHQIRLPLVLALNGAVNDLRNV